MDHVPVFTTPSDSGPPRDPLDAFDDDQDYDLIASSQTSLLSGLLRRGRSTAGLYVNLPVSPGAAVTPRRI